MKIILNNPFYIFNVSEIFVLLAKVNLDQKFLGFFYVFFHKRLRNAMWENVSKKYNSWCVTHLCSGVYMQWWAQMKSFGSYFALCLSHVSTELIYQKTWFHC